MPGGMQGGILEGIRVLELGSGVSSPFCAKLLADYGADVIKVESPSIGDPARRVGPFVGDDPHPDKSIPFLYLNTNKRGITLDFASQSGRGAFHTLLQSADVLVEDFPPAESHALGLQHQTLSAINPALVQTSVTAFGHTGPYWDFVATDIVGLRRERVDVPLRRLGPGALAQRIGPVFVRGGCQCGCGHPDGPVPETNNRHGQHVDVSVVECLASHLVQAVPYYSYMGAIKGRRAVLGSGFEELMPARDGYAVPSVQGSQPWAVVADLIGLEELKDERFATGSGRIQHGEELKRLLIKGLAEWDRKSLFQASGERRLVFGMAQDAEDLLQCPHLRERGFFVEVDHPVAGRAQYPGTGPVLSEVEFEIGRPAPLLGQHNREIYCDELGFSPDDLVNLRVLSTI